MSAPRRDRFVVDFNDLRWKLPAGVRPKQALRDSVLSELSEKSVERLAINFAVDLSETLTRVLNGEARASTLERMLTDYINDNARLFYIEGMFDSDEFETRAEAEESMEPDDEQAVQDWIDTQLESAGSFAQDAAAAHRTPPDERAAAEQAILDRADLWEQSFIGLGEQGKMSALRNEMGVWQLGDTEEHCHDDNGKRGCAELNGKAHRLSWYADKGLVPGMPGSQTTCGGFHCDCQIVSRKTGKVLVG